MDRRHLQFEILEDVHETLTDALKQVANEPSVGLYFVQQHVHKAAPTLLAVKDQLVESTADAELATADAKDALSCIKIMKECGPSIIENMIRKLKSASNTMPVIRQSRGSVSQLLLPKPARPPGARGGPLRSSSFVGAWQSETSTEEKKMIKSGKFPRERHLKTPKTNAPSATHDPSVAPVVSNVKSGEMIQDQVLHPSQSSEAATSLDNAMGKEQFDKVERSLQHPEACGVSSKGSNHSGDSFEQFQAEHAAKLEAWLSAPDQKLSLNP